MKPVMTYFCLALLATANLAVPASAEGEEISEIVPFDCKIEQEDGYGPIIFIKKRYGWSSPEPSAFKNIQKTKNGFAFELSDFAQSLGFITKERGDKWSLNLLTEQGSATGTCYDKTDLVDKLKGPIGELIAKELDELRLEVARLNTEASEKDTKINELRLAYNKVSAIAALKNPMLIGALEEQFGYTTSDTDLEAYRFNNTVDPYCLSTFKQPASYIGTVCLKNLKNSLQPKKN